MKFGEKNLQHFFETLWHDYQLICPDAKKIETILSGFGGEIVNDHIAFRSVKVAGLGMDNLMQPFEQLGYVKKETYYFTSKNLQAAHYEHIHDKFPKIFISQYLLENAPDEIQQFWTEILGKIDRDQSKRLAFLGSGKRWPISFAQYENLAKTSEYLAWFYAFGYRANHFTVDCNQLNSISSLQELNEIFKNQQLVLNSQGGEIKGSEAELLEQSSTMAREINWEFAEGIKSIPGCYMEFAKRYPGASGRLYQGFIQASANHLFASTNKKTA